MERSGAEIGAGGASARAGAPARECGECSLCCTVLRVDEIGKLGGKSCRHQRVEGGCAIHAQRPQICRAYRCLWLKGSFRDADRPDLLDAVVDLVPEGGLVVLAIRQARPGAYDDSVRLQEIAAEFRQSMPVRITDVEDVLNADRPFRVLLPDGTEQRVSGEQISIYRDGELVEERRLSWLERIARNALVKLRQFKLRRVRSRSV